MENTTAQHTPQPYRDSPPPSRSSSPAQHTSSPSTSSTNSAATVKPLPALPQAPAYEPYRDDPTPNRSSASHPRQQQHQQQPYSDTTPPFTPHDDDNIPLAHLLLNPYPHEAPPSYSVAVRQTHSYRDTLIQYIPSDERGASVVIEIDEESGEVISRTDDVRHSVEKVVAMFVVAGLLLILSGVLAWLAMGSGLVGR